MIGIKNWSQFQHFKDRTPPWIKLYRDILVDPDWHDLKGEDAKYLVMLWLIASEDKERLGRLPCNRKVAFRLRITETKLKQVYTNLKNWLVQDDIKMISGRYQDDIKMISSRYQDDTPETETEGETETELTKVSSKDSTAKIPHKKIIDYLNEKANTSYRYTSKITRRLIKARYNEGFTIEHFYSVIDGRVAEWGRDDKMVAYLRPQTLFGTKFESYLQASDSETARTRRIVEEALRDE